ncbi:hypothetical protein SADUNF_Sadunf08G0058700 [Salix dunnii]|uniref:Secreted protein n=1 Tax=Salix dunnii TaxID=1413687 RepID=A0A835MTG7_9ROSI|nr:hypothetical protein SADUNF_Sadunf08G0058700 [Salix dunnii]
MLVSLWVAAQLEMLLCISDQDAHDLCESSQPNRFRFIKWKANLVSLVITWEDHSHEVAISSIDNPYRACHAPDMSTVAECTDTPILRKEAELNRPTPTSH